jgi:hypothetical protein
LSRRLLIVGLGAVGLAAALLAIGGGRPYRLSAADRPFDHALGNALDRGGAIDLRELEPGDWNRVCGVGEGSPFDALKAANLPTTPAAGEAELGEFFDEGSASRRDEASSALVFVTADGAQVRPASKLHIISGGALDACVERADALLLPTADGWRLGAAR